MKVLLLNNVPAPYFLPLFEELGKTPGWQLTVCYTTNWNRTVGWQNATLSDRSSYRTIILDQLGSDLSSSLGVSLSIAIKLWNFLGNERPDYLICYGYTLKPQMFLLVWAMITKTPFALTGDANYYFDGAKGLKRIAKNAWLRLVIKRASALVTIGTASKLFWEKYGATPSQLFSSRLVVDNDFFSKAKDALSETAKDWRNRLKLGDKVVFLFVGRLIKRKNINLIIQAAHLLNPDEFGVVIVGSGEEAESLKLLASGKSNIHFSGNVDPGDLPAFYRMADVLVLPADDEPWGLVVNEAMVCGLAVIAYKFCGAAIDLVDSDNGIVLQGFSIKELANAMQFLVTNRSLLLSMQLKSEEKIKDWSIESAAKGMILAVESTCYKQ
jgi:glycosyltransferase involved in cell wall biosynthesis